MAAVTFDDNDMHADDPTHNRPLFITGKANGVNLSCITINGGFAINVISARVLSELGVELAKLQASTLVIQGFNQSEQKPLGSVKLKMKFGDI